MTAIGLLVADSTMPSSERPVSSDIVLVGSGGSSSQPQPTSGADAAPDVGQAAATFAIGGKVTGLFPGALRPLVLTISNRNDYAITVTSIHTTVANASSKCGARDVTVTSFSGHVTVGARRSVHVTTHVKMLRTVGNACRGVVFPFHYTGVATGG